MLSDTQQKMLLKMLGFWLREEVWNSYDMRGFYRSQSAFYRSIKYLEKSELIYEFEEDREDNMKYYCLTKNGVFLSKILCLLADLPEYYKSLYPLEKYTDLDMKMFEGGASNG